MSKIKVMHILTDTNIGGAGTLLCQVLACRDRERFEYVVVLPAGSRLIPRVEATGCRVLTVSGGRDRSADMAAILPYIRLLRRERPDILHTHSALAARIAGGLCGVRDLVSIQTRHCVFPLTRWQKTGAFRFAFRHGTRLLTDRVIAVAEAARDQLCQMGLSHDEVEVIINGVEPIRVCGADEVAATRAKLGLREGDFVAGMVARLEEYKGQGTLLRAASICLQRMPNLVILLVGDGSCEGKYRALADELGIAERVIFAGFAEDTAPYYAVMDVNVNASFGTETSSLALSEGMSMGLPALASRYGGNPAMVVEGENGLLFDTHDHAALADLLLRLGEDKALYERLSAGARRHYAARLTARGMVERLERLYERVLYQARRRKRRERYAPGAARK